MGLSAVILAALLLAGCTIPAPGPSTTGTTTTPAEPVPSATAPAPVAPILVPDGTASDNLPLFTSVTAAVWATEERTAGRAYIDALVSAGFDKAAMQVTNDLSTVGNAAESILFSVRWGEECLVGQVGPATGEPATIVVPALAEGNCLVGSTRPIDW
ncbi:hypothetical protein KEC57_09000 [Microbacterium sp. BWT-G7]|uniref:DUF6993 domain-containing protein n=1 Tax=Microbacterium allomyrinae TaxID=2830666 RepID=A0A9X1LVP2_9MICO|nr:hypothetical protein [Microbacterium allomyrinae]